MIIRNTGIFTSISRAAILATVLVATGGVAQAAEEHIAPPSAADVAILRGLLALQHPALRNASIPAQAAAPAVVPTVTNEPASSKDGREA